MTHVGEVPVTALGVADPVEIHEAQQLVRHEAPRVPTAIPGAGSIIELLHAAVKQGTPVAELKELVALHEHMEQRQARQAFFAALAAFQQAVEPIVRKRKADVATRDAGAMKYAYANVDDIAQAIRPALLAHGLSYKWDQKLDGGNCTTLCTVMHIDGHAETSSFTVPTESRAGMSPQQKVGAAMSYGQARVLGIALGITTTDAEPDAIDPTPVTDEQLAEIQDAIEQHGVPADRYLKALEVTKASAIRKVDFMRAMQMIDEFVERQAAKAAAKAKKGGAAP